ncbi:MAG: LptF/LptG family permease [Armatimonadota bacterium]|nr:LptF/LptG family permease [Armatimonadota bacterium]
MRIIDHYILGEALGPFLVALLAFIVLITGHMLFNVVEVIVEHGVPLPSVLHFVALQMPGAAVLALPVATLMGCSLAVNRLASDHEIVAMRAGAASLWRVLAPLWVLGALTSVLTLALNEGAVPWSRQQAEHLVREMVLRRQSLAFEPGKFTDTGQGIEVFVGERSGGPGELRDVLVFQTQPGDWPLLVAARRAVFRGDRLYPLGARLYYFDGRGLTTLRPAQAVVDLRQVASGAEGIPGPTGLSELTLRELAAEVREREQAAAGTGRSYAMELHARLAMAASCLVFAALAGPVTLRFARGQSLVGVMAAMIITFAYFLVMIWTRALGEGGVLPVPVAAWVQNVVLIAAAALGVRLLR